MEKIQPVVAGSEPVVAAALKFALKPAAAPAVIAGIRDPWLTEKNGMVGRLEPMRNELKGRLM